MRAARQMAVLALAFQSALRSGERSDRCARRNRGRVAVSIRASLRRAKRWGIRSPFCPPVRFNPRFAPESEAIRKGKRERQRPHRFQSALRSGERSDATSAPALPNATTFQSALRSGERSDRRGRRHRGSRRCFNPRFAPESEAIAEEIRGRVDG